ncbi:hypothetical protein [Pararobbsia alpina]|uniref:Glycosyltransferase RgtA/B/C/D-like domain-containing protein n=1 Tax=Pararobbsia alpina TaxID=621374 RepID=A0A6S7BEP4_9BURK|nr:hypothetical protein [Pararobbsia alpina]CAB3797889.1 hypothetical protein LMG28138_04340 [Pararobbsia alpina]
MLNRPGPSRTSAWILLIFIYYIAAASSFGGFFTKWHFRDDSPMSLRLALDGTQKRPFVYRQLLPSTANLIDSVIPEKVKVPLLHKLAGDTPDANPIQRFFPGATDAVVPEYAVRYLIVYVMTFLSMFAALFVIRAVCIELIGDRVAATLAPIVISAVFPLILTEGGYFYDMPEVLFMALGIWLTLRRRLVSLVVVVFLATLNKESYLLFVLTLYPIAAMRYSRPQSGLLIGVLLAVAAAVNMAVKHRYMGNGGGMMEYQLAEHARFLLNPLNYLRTEINYGVSTTKGFHILHLLLIGILAKIGWRSLPPAVRTQTWLAALISVPLFIAFCFKDELRNLSLLTMPFAFLVCATISVVLAQTEKQGAHQPVMPREREPLLAQGERASAGLTTRNST